MTDISIVIPTFNRLWALPQAIDSCLAASGPAVEVIVVDDGSTDGTWEFLRDRTDIVAIRTPNWGKDWAVQAAMQVASGEYVRFLDSDDWLKPGANAAQLAIARDTDADVVVAGYADYWDDGRPSQVHPWIDCDDFVAQQLGEVAFSHYSAFLFRRSFVADIPHRQEFALRDDRMFMLEVAIAKPRLAVYRGPAFVHRHHRQNRLQRNRGLQERLAHYTNVQVMRKAIGLLERQGEATARRKQAAAAYLWPVVRDLAKTELDEAAVAARWLLELAPGYTPRVRPIILAAYKHLGFRTTERLVRLRSLFRKSPPGPAS
ncbi:MAG: glycosyltransferase family 2 protein [Reyranellaceae bacterium]